MRNVQHLQPKIISPDWFTCLTLTVEKIHFKKMASESHTCEGVCVLIVRIAHLMYLSAFLLRSIYTIGLNNLNNKKRNTLFFSSASFVLTFFLFMF